MAEHFFAQNFGIFTSYNRKQIAEDRFMMIIELAGIFVLHCVNVEHIVPVPRTATSMTGL